MGTNGLILNDQFCLQHWLLHQMADCFEWCQISFMYCTFRTPPPFPLNFWQKYWMSVCSPDVNLVDFTKWYMFVVCIAGIYILANVLNDVMHFPHILSQCCIFNGQYWKCFTFIKWPFFNWYCSLNILIVVIWVKLDNTFNKFEINNNDVW